MRFGLQGAILEVFGHSVLLWRTECPECTRHSRWRRNPERAKAWTYRHARKRHGAAANVELNY